MKLSRTVSYALRATLLLAQEETKRPVPCSQLAKEGEMPERFLLQILRNLVNEGLLRSTRGVDGGYTLVQSPSELSVLDIIEAIEGPMSSEVLENAAQPSDVQQLATPGPDERLQSALRDVSQTLRQQLDAIKIAHLLPSPSNHN
mgnify:CR=1 FL=1